MIINFYPESDSRDYTEGIKEYKQIWSQDGTKIIETMERVSGLIFKETTINAIVFMGMSQSHPLLLKATYPIEEKKATIIHELGHRLLSAYGLNNGSHDPAQSFENHKRLDLILYDIWIDLYGEVFAKQSVEDEKILTSKRTMLYSDAWDWALSFTRDQRAHEFAKLQ